MARIVGLLTRIVTASCRRAFPELAATKSSTDGRAGVAVLGGSGGAGRPGQYARMPARDLAALLPYELSPDGRLA